LTFENSENVLLQKLNYVKIDHQIYFMRYLLIILSLFLFISLSTAEAQQRGITYESLLQRVDQPNAYITPILIPISDEESFYLLQESEAVFSGLLKMHNFQPVFRWD